MPSARTTVRVLAGAKALAIGIVCDDPNPNGIVSFSVRRDAPLTNEDHVRIALGPFLDGRSGYVFAVNPSGGLKSFGHPAVSDDPIAADFLEGDLLYTQHRTLTFYKNLNQLSQPRHRRVDHLVSQQDGEWFVADQVLRAEDRVSQAEGLRLANVAEVGQFRDAPHLFQHAFFFVAL